MKNVVVLTSWQIQSEKLTGEVTSICIATTNKISLQVLFLEIYLQSLSIQSLQEK